MNDRSVTHATFTIERFYQAPVSRVFAAWGDPVAKNRWFANVQDPDQATMQVDFRIGGTERNTFALKEDGPIYFYEAFFHDIVPDERIVLTNHMRADDDRIAVNVVSIEFVPDGDGTKMTLIDHGAYLDGFDRVEWREEGVRHELDRLETELARHP